MVSLEVLVETAIVVEVINLISLAWIVLWTKRAGSRIVDSIAMRLGLRTGRAGKNASPLDALQAIVDRVLPGKEAPAAEAEEKSIDIPGIGTVTESEIQGLAAKYLPQAKQLVKAGQGDKLALPGGDMDILSQLAKGGKGLSWEDAIPWVISLLNTPVAPGQAQGGKPANPNDTNSNW